MILGAVIQGIGIILFGAAISGLSLAGCRSERYFSWTIDRVVRRRLSPEEKLVTRRWLSVTLVFFVVVGLIMIALGIASLTTES